MKDHELGWALIPPHVIAADDLCMGEKVICGRVMGLTGKHGYCFASNEWLGAQLGYSHRTVGDYVSKLVKKGYLRREYGPNGKRDRRLFPITEIPVNDHCSSSNPLLPKQRMYNRRVKNSETVESRGRSKQDNITHQRNAAGDAAEFQAAVQRRSKKGSKAVGAHT